MRLSIQRIGEGALALAVLVLLTALIAPWRRTNLAESPSKAMTEVSPDPAGAIAEPARATLDSLYNLFAARAAAAPSAAVKPAAAVAKKASDAPWLRYIGNITGAEGKTYYFFKDTRSNRSISLSAGEIVNGWTLVEISDAKFVLKNNEDLYTVNKR